MSNLESHIFKKNAYEYYMASNFIDPFTGMICSPLFIESLKRDVVEIMFEKWKYPQWFYLTFNFYVSSYICPKCYSLLFKTVFPKDHPIDTVEGIKRIPRIFTCGECLTFYAPKPGYRLADNNGYVLEFDDQFEYMKLLYEFDDNGSMHGRQGTIDKSKY